jgi:hypothetical protein
LLLRVAIQQINDISLLVAVITTAVTIIVLTAAAIVTVTVAATTIGVIVVVAIQRHLGGSDRVMMWHIHCCSGRLAVSRTEAPHQHPCTHPHALP